MFMSLEEISNSLKTFEQAKEKQDQLNAACDTASNTLNKYPVGPMGLTPDNIKATPEYRRDKACFEIAFKALQDYNKWFCKRWKRELSAFRQQERLNKLNQK
ncbi:hypothetical protein D3C76_165270 [compost metagenome]